MEKSSLAGKHIISHTDIGNCLDDLFIAADRMKQAVEQGKELTVLRGKILACAFYEASTRTYASFIAAMQRLGGDVIPIQGVEFSSMAKGEDIPDTMRALECYADAIVFRHKETGSAKLAASVMTKPLINAGDGTGEHPTQAFLDAYTIVSECGRSFSGTVTMLGDLKNGRTVHSLAHLLAHHFPGIHLRFVAPPRVQLPEDHLERLKALGVPHEVYTDLSDAISGTDVLYVTRLQKERFMDNLEEYERLKGSYDITPATLERLREKATIMHPFPRVGEIATSVDKDPRAAYFRQMQNGLYVRMALLRMVLGA